MSQVTDIAHKVNELGSAWEQFKRVNDARLKEIERKGSSDVLRSDELGRIQETLDATQDQMRRMEAAMHRPGAISVPEVVQKSVADHLAAKDYGRAFAEYVRKGADMGLAVLEKKALSVGSDPDGGYLVTPKMSEFVAKKIYESSPLRQLARVEVISGDALDVIEDFGEAGAGWTAETGSISESSSPQIGKRTIPLHELYAQPKATQRLIDDAAIDVELWLAEKISEIFARKEATAFISGDGVGKPRGITTYPAGTGAGQIQQVVSGDSGDVTADGLFELFYALKEEHAARASFLMHRSVLQRVRLLKESSTGQYLWTPYMGDAQPETLLGLPVYSAVDMPVAAADSLSVALGDFRAAYQIADREGIRILRDPFTEKPFVKFYATKRVGGDVVNPDAIKLLKLSDA